MDWRAWDGDYEDADSPLAQRLVLVQRQIAAALDHAKPGALRTVSMCAGQGHDLIGVLSTHPRGADVSARLVELDEHNAHLARSAANDAGLHQVEVAVADASITDAYAGAVPADVILLCGVFGNIADADIAATIRNLPALCAPEASVIWTRHRHPPDRVPLIRAAFHDAGFEELGLEEAPPFAVATNRLISSPRPFVEGVRMFEFVGYDVLAPEFHASGAVRAVSG